MKRDAETLARTRDMIDALKKETFKIQDEVIYGTGATKLRSIAGGHSTSYGTKFGGAGKFLPDR